MALRVGAGLRGLGHDARLWVLQATGALHALPTTNLPLDVVDAGSALKSIPKLRKLLAADRPDVVIANMTHMAFAAIVANASVRAKAAVIVVEHNTLSVERARSNRRFERQWPLLARVLYPMASRVVGVSRGVARDLTANVGLPDALVTAIYNPVLEEVGGSREALVGQPRSILWCGRFVSQKRPDLMLQAFRRVLDGAPALLTMLGEGPLLQSTKELANSLGLGDYVTFPGFALDPSAFYERADTLVLTSDYEGLGNVLVEALSSGLRVVSTDCPSGPREVLEGLRGTRLVPVGDAAAIAEAVSDVAAEGLDAGGVRERLELFTAEYCIRAYDRLLGEVTAQ